MRKNASEMNQVVEQIQQGPLLGAESPSSDPATFGIKLDELFSQHDWFDNQHSVVRNQASHLVTDGRQGPVLDLDQLAVAYNIDSVSPQRRLNRRVGVGVQFLQLAV